MKAIGRKAVHSNANINTTHKIFYNPNANITQ